MLEEEEEGEDPGMRGVCEVIGVEEASPTTTTKLFLFQHLILLRLLLHGRGGGGVTQLLVLKLSLQMWMVVIRIWMVREGLGGKGV